MRYYKIKKMLHTSLRNFTSSSSYMQNHGGKTIIIHNILETMVYLIESPKTGGYSIYIIISYTYNV